MIVATFDINGINHCHATLEDGPNGIKLFIGVCLQDGPLKQHFSQKDGITLKANITLALSNFTGLKLRQKQIHFASYGLFCLKVEQAIASKAITAGEGLTITHHYAMGSRAASRYTSASSMVLIADISRRVRLAK
jgi:hypothetical protein